jgi:hypothetical protein
VELRAKDVLKVQERALKAAENRSKLGAPAYKALLTAPGERESEDEAADIAKEFYQDDVIDGETGEVIQEGKGASSTDVEKKLAVHPSREDETQGDTDNPDQPKLF